jgi:hypothetical protein
MKQNLCRLDIRKGLMEQLRIQAILEETNVESVDEAIHGYLKELGVAGEVVLTDKGKRCYGVNVMVGGELFNFEVTLRG